VLDEGGKEAPIVMGSYGIGIERILAGAVELHHDADGIRMPMSIAPFHLALLPLQMQDAAVRQTAEKLYLELTQAGVEVLLDDRDDRAGVKFKDADLIGLPLRIAVGKKGLAEGKVEWKQRGAKDVELIALADVVGRAQAAVRDGGGRLGGEPDLCGPRRSRPRRSGTARLQARGTRRPVQGRSGAIRRPRRRGRRGGAQVRLPIFLDLKLHDIPQTVEGPPRASQPWVSSTSPFTPAAERT